jgi:hypothetical protein
MGRCMLVGEGKHSLDYLRPREPSISRTFQPLSRVEVPLKEAARSFAVSLQIMRVTPLGML